MAKLKDIAKYIRSKNAGPFWVTFEIFCDSEKEYSQILESGKINAREIASLYGTQPDAVQIFEISGIYVIKISFPRPYPSGYRYERDMHFGQQYRLLAELEL